MYRTRSWILVAWLAACSNQPAKSDDPPPPNEDPSADASTPTDTTDAAGSSNDDASPPGDEPPADASPPDGGGGGDVDRCPDGFPRGAAGDVRQVVKISPAPEGVAACANGDVFVSVPDEGKILRVPLDGGDPEVWTTLSGRQPLGMTCADDVLFVVDFRSKDATVLRVAAKNDPGTPMPNVSGGSFKAMNGVVAIKGLGIYATDASNTLSGRIVRFKETPSGYEASVVKSGLAFPNGIIFDPATNTMDVSLTVQSKVLTFPVGADGALGDSKEAWSGTVALDAIDGIVRDENKALYIAHYLKGYVGRVSDGAKIASLKDPKSLVFRGGTLLITGTEGLYAAPLGICGIP